MLTIRCPICKEEILIVPDKKEMGKVIEEHAKRKHPELEYETEDHLNALLFKKVTEKL